MLTDERRRRLLETLRRDGRIVAKDAARAFGLSEDTIRRDLRDLAADGRLQRVHGGALPASPAMGDLAARRSISTSEKTALARAGAATIARGQVAFLDGGTTTLELARQLDRSLEATIVTHSPTIAAALVDAAADVHLIGGRLFKHSMVAVGADAAAAIGNVRADLFFMGATGVHAEHGLSTGDPEEAAIKRAIAKRSADVTVMASSEKIGAASPFIIGPIDLAGVVMTAVSGSAVDAIAAQGVRIVTVWAGRNN